MAEKTDIFETITLEEMDAVKLLNRVDTKFVFHACELPAILEEMTGNYRILEVAGSRSTHYKSLYFDLPDYGFYLWHHNGKANRIKVRFRQYVDSDTTYFEIKKKTNKGRTEKVRVKTTGIGEEISGKAKILLEETTGIEAATLKPSLSISFTRCTFVDADMTERLTIDTDLVFSNGKTDSSFKNLVIAEIKQDRSGRSLFRNILHNRHINDFRISKYCLGIADLKKDIKQNNFKFKLTHIKKIIHERS